MERYFRKTKIPNSPYQRMVPCVPNDMSGHMYQNVMIDTNNKRFSVPEPMMQVQAMDTPQLVSQPYRRTYDNVSGMGDQIHFLQTDKENNYTFPRGGFGDHTFDQNNEYTYSDYDRQKHAYEMNGGHLNIEDSNPHQYLHRPTPIRPVFHPRAQPSSFQENRYKNYYPRAQQMEIVDINSPSRLSSSSTVAVDSGAVKSDSVKSKGRISKMDEYFPSTTTTLSPEMQKSTLSDTPEVKSSAKRQEVSADSNRAIVDKVPSDAKSTDGTSYKTVLDKQRAIHGSGLHVFTGTVEKILKWHRALQPTGLLTLFEVIAKCVSVRPGTGCEKHLLLRDNSGPVLQATYFEIDFLLPEIKPGSTVRVVGQMIGANKMKVAKVREAAPFESASLPRLCAISQHLIGKILNLASSN